MELEYLKHILGTRLFVKLPRPGDSEGTFSIFQSSCHVLLSVYSFIGRGNPIKCLAQGHNKQTCMPIFILGSLFYVERQAGKLWIPNLKIFWFN